MDRFQALNVFIKVADLGSFNAAARDLAMSPPAVTRAVASIEDRLGTRLFVRTTRSVRLTESGERFLQDGRQILLDLDEAEAAAVGSHIAPRGTLSITAPVLFGRIFITPLLGDYLNEFPHVNCQTLFLDRIVNLMDEGQDVAIRIGQLPDSSLTAIRVGQVRRVLFASPSYLKKHGLPQHPSELSEHRLVHASTMGQSSEWIFQENKKRFSLPIRPRISMNTNDAAIELVLNGWGIGHLLSYQIAPHLNSGQLKTILSSFEQPAIPINVIHQQGRMVSAKVRSFVDYAVERLRSDPTLN